jgi:hypothetical protein
MSPSRSAAGRAFFLVRGLAWLTTRRTCTCSPRLRPRRGRGMAAPCSGQFLTGAVLGVMRAVFDPVGVQDALRGVLDQVWRLWRVPHGLDRLGGGFRNQGGAGGRSPGGFRPVAARLRSAPCQPVAAAVRLGGVPGIGKLVRIQQRDLCQTWEPTPSRACASAAPPARCGLAFPDR